jgi:hypothetical protein
VADSNIELYSTMTEPTPRGFGLLGTPHAHLGEGAEGRLELQLSGCLPHDWSLRLTRGLAANRLGVHSGYARLVEPACWLAQLELDSCYGGSGEQDFLALAMRSSALPALRDPRILDFQLRESASLGGSLELRVDAWDSLGLLAAVLGRAALAGLHPVEINLETEGECAFHQLTLKSQGGGRPARPEGLLLARQLADLCDR